MSAFLHISFHLLDERFHGRAAGGSPEWPPSPYRAWQALLAAAAALRRTSGDGGPLDAVQALEEAPPPLILAPRSSMGKRVLTYVPNNDGDLVGRGSKTFAELRTAKLVAERTLEHGQVSYLWPVAGLEGQIEPLRRAARAVAALGWGQDMAIADAQILDSRQMAALPGERWAPAPAGPSRLRVPVRGSAVDLEARHQEFLSRLDREELSPPKPPSAFGFVSYAREGEESAGVWPVFLLRRPDGRGLCAFDPARSGLRLAGMTRGAAHAAARAEAWPEDFVRSRVMGHGPAGEDPPGHLAFVPLPSIEPRGEGGRPVAGPARRVMLWPSGPGAHVAARWLGEVMAGAELVDERSGEAQAILEPVGPADAVTRSYTAASATWSTVTPVVLPGHDDKAGLRRKLREEPDPERQSLYLARLNARVEALLRKAIVQAGLGETLARCAELSWQREPFWRGSTLAGRYGLPGHLQGASAWHVRVDWRDGQGQPLAVSGPIVLGSGRFYGLGLFAAEAD